jgi:hypothetical protein
MDDIEEIRGSIHRINSKLLKIYKDRQELQGRSEWYKNNICKDRMLEFIHQNKKDSKSHDWRIPNINTYNLCEFWNYICKNDL